MGTFMGLPETALQIRAHVSPEGKIEVPVPFPSGTPVVVFVVEESANGTADLTSAAQSSLDFWDNALDDEDWNGA
jgi:hypothetical protein